MKRFSSEIPKPRHNNSDDPSPVQSGPIYPISVVRLFKTVTSSRQTFGLESNGIVLPVSQNKISSGIQQQTHSEQSRQNPNLSQVMWWQAGQSHNPQKRERIGMRASFPTQRTNQDVSKIRSSRIISISVVAVPFPTNNCSTMYCNKHTAS